MKTRKYILRNLIDCFGHKYYKKYNYLGYLFIPFKTDSKPFNHILNFLKWMDKEVKPKWCPRWFLNLLHLIGNNNSVIQVKNQTLHKLHKKLTRNIMITDLKTKYGTMRIYGYFTQEIQNEITKVCEKVNPFIEEY